MQCAARAPKAWVCVVCKRRRPLCVRYQKVSYAGSSVPGWVGPRGIPLATAEKRARWGRRRHVRRGA